MKIVECSKSKVIESISSFLGGGMGFHESWLDEEGIDADSWRWSDPATGTAWLRAVDGAYKQVSAVLAANETCRLRTYNSWVLGPDTWGTNTIPRRTIAEWGMKLADVTNLDNTATMFGWCPAINGTRTAMNVNTFCLLADVLSTLTDAAGTETAATTFSETLTNWNKFKIVTEAGAIYFYLNQALIASHTANLPDVPSYLTFYGDSEGAANGTIQIGEVKIWQEAML